MVIGKFSSDNQNWADVLAASDKGSFFKQMNLLALAE